MPPTPLFEEERHACVKALISELAEPLDFDRSVAVARLATGDDPVNSVEPQPLKWAKKWFGRDEPDRSRDVSKIVRTHCKTSVLDRHPHPHISWPRKIRGQRKHALMTFCQHLECMPARHSHNVEDGKDE